MTRSILTRALSISMLLPLLAVGFGCAQTSAPKPAPYTGPLPSPKRILVYNFAVTPQEVQLDPSLSREIAEAAKKQPRSEQERQIGQACADALAKDLVEELQGMGYVVARSADTHPSLDVNSL